MQLKILIATTLMATAGQAIAAGPTTTGASAAQGNRVVGIWSNASQVGPCGQPATTTGDNTVIFQAGGTLVDNPRAPAGTPTQRSIGLGVWSYNRATGQYSQRVQFDWFLNGAYDGYQVVWRDFLLSNDGNVASGDVTTARYNADGSVRAELCGSAVSNRI